MKKIIIGFIIFLSLFSTYSLIKADYKTDIISMLPLEDEVIREQYQVLSAFGSMEKVVFEVSKKDSSVSWTQLVQDVGVLFEELNKDTLFLFNSNVTPESFFELRNSLIKNWPSLLSVEDSIYISSRLNSDSLESMLDRVLSSLFTFSSSSADAFLLQSDPFGFNPILLKRMAAFSPSKEIRVRDGLLTNIENDKILLIAEFNNNKDESAVSKRVDEIKLKLSDKTEFIWMGAVRASIDNTNSIKRDINVTLPVTITMILLICLLIYRNKIYGFITFIPTILSILITFGLFAFFTDFSLIIVGFAAALMGITVDFAIHYLYHVDSVKSDPTPLKTVKSPILASAFTTAGAFLVLYTSKIPALGQLGVITAFGIVMAASLSLLLLPLFVKNGKSSKDAIFNPTSVYTKFYQSKLSSYLAIPLIVVALIITVFVIKLKFDGDPDNMNGMSKATIEVEKKLSKNWSGIGEGAYLTVSANDFDSLLMKCEDNLVPFLKDMSEKDFITSGDPFSIILPSKRAQQKNKIRWLNLFTDKNRAIMKEAINEVSARYNLPPDPFYKYVDELANKKVQDITLESYPSFLKNGMLKNSLVLKDSLWIGAIPVVSKADSLWAVIDKEARVKGIIAVNDDVLGFRIVTLIKKAFVKSALIIPIVIMIIILLMLKSFKAAIQVFIPTSLAAGLTLGLMGLLNIRVNIVTMMVFAFIFGLGIDYALLMYYMTIKELKEDAKFVSHGASSVTVAAATTLSGLGVLILAKHPVIVTLGTTGVIGIVSSYICAVVLVPWFVKSFK